MRRSRYARFRLTFWEIVAIAALTVASVLYLVTMARNTVPHGIDRTRQEQPLYKGNP